MLTDLQYLQYFDFLSEIDREREGERERERERVREGERERLFCTYYFTFRFSKGTRILSCLFHNIVLGAPARINVPSVRCLHHSPGFQEAPRIKKMPGNWCLW